VAGWAPDRDIGQAVDALSHFGDGARELMTHDDRRLLTGEGWGLPGGGMKIGPSRPGLPGGLPQYRRRDYCDSHQAVQRSGVEVEEGPT
jgi:hypothetical protein